MHGGVEPRVRVVELAGFTVLFCFLGEVGLDGHRSLSRKYDVLVVDVVHYVQHTFKSILGTIPLL